MNIQTYLRRIGLTPSDLGLKSGLGNGREVGPENGLRPDGEPPPRSAVRRLQRAHLTSVPFDTLSVAGGPFGRLEPTSDRVLLEPEALYQKIVEEGRGGICYELNELFRGLLTALGIEAHRLAARVVAPDGTLGPPGDHMPLLVPLDEGPHLVDVGFGGDVIWSPLPLDGTPQEGPEGAWRLVERDRPSADYAAQSRGFGFRGEGWSDRFLFRAEPRPLSYIEPACEYHRYAPDATFTDWPLVVRATERGHKALSGTTLTTVRAGDGEEPSVTEEEVSEEQYASVLREEFGIELNAEKTAG
ncbi:MAG: arylamine N-acetyltransferase [Salinibacter sp.]